MKMSNTDQMFGLAAGIVASLTVCRFPAAAQKYPAQNVRVIVRSSPGGAVDAFGRGIGCTLQQSFGSMVIVDNRPGANCVLGAVLAAKVPPYGSFLFLIWGGHFVYALLTK